MNPEIWLILENIRSCYNVGSIFRTADGAGIAGIIGTGLTPLPTHTADTRKPHISARADRQIAKTALGAELTVPFRHYASTPEAIRRLKTEGYVIAALEQSKGSVALQDYVVTAPKLALILGNEESGVMPDSLSLCDVIIEIPMHGSKRSLNVSVAAGIAAFHLTSKE